MREIKFRAWDKDRKKIGIVHNILFGIEPLSKTELMHRTEYQAIHLLDGSIPKLEDEFTVTIEILRGDEIGDTSKYIMQYTGLKDQNNKEIYEGDIVGMFHNTQRSLVEWDIECGCWSISMQKSVGHHVTDELLGAHLSVVEIIGNIYQNPELIKYYE